MRPEPTPKQFEVYYFIIKYVQDNGYQPSQTEIASSLGVSRPVIEKRMVSLERKGFIERTKGKSDRAIRLPGLKFKAMKDERRPKKKAGK